MTNKHAEEYINYYLDLTTEPQYAIMLKGAWGSGKTWFIENVLKRYKVKHKNFKFLKISLYGIDSIEQIENEFYRQLHPVLSNKKFIFSANVLKNTLKATLRFDFDGDGKNESNLNVNIPSISLSDFSREPNGFVLVFDDVERSGISLSLLFGYINHFVEVNGYKAILIANEDEIIKNNERENKNDEESKDQAQYTRTKEKLIGKTFEINSDLQGACKVFLRVINSSSVANIFKSDIKTVEIIYKTSGYNNLRNLRQFFLDVERITHLMTDKYLKNEDFLRVFYQQMLIFSMEYRGGGIKYKEFDSIGETNWGLMFGGVKKTSKFDDIVRKYSSPVLSDKILTGEVWRELICDGKVTDTFFSQLNTSRFFRDNDAPAWRYLWSYQELTESVLNEQSLIVRNNFFSRKITLLGELLMTVSILIELARNRFINDNVGEITTEAKIQIDSYFNNLSPEEIQEEYRNSYRNELQAFCGMVFLNANGDFFKVITEYVRHAKQKRFEASLPEFARQFRDELENGHLTLISELSPSTKRKLNIYSLSFLHWVESDVFIKNYIRLEPVIMRRLNCSLLGRYSDANNIRTLREELSWLNSLKFEAQKFIGKPGCSAYDMFHLNILINYALNEAIESFNK